MIREPLIEVGFRCEKVETLSATLGNKTLAIVKVGSEHWVVHGNTVIATGMSYRVAKALLDKLEKKYVKI